MEFTKDIKRRMTALVSGALVSPADADADGAPGRHTCMKTGTLTHWFHGSRIFSMTHKWILALFHHTRLTQRTKDQLTDEVSVALGRLDILTSTTESHCQWHCLHPFLALTSMTRGSCISLDVSRFPLRKWIQLLLRKWKTINHADLTVHGCLVQEVQTENS